MQKQEQVRDVNVKMATFRAVWVAIHNQRKKDDDFEIRLEFLEKRVNSIVSKLGDQLNIQPIKTDAIGKVV